MQIKRTLLSKLSDAHFLSSFLGVFGGYFNTAVSIIIERTYSNNKQSVLMSIHSYHCSVGGRSVYPGEGVCKVLSCAYGHQ